MLPSGWMGPGLAVSMREKEMSVYTREILAGKIESQALCESRGSDGLKRMARGWHVVVASSGS
jgi:hypothetical protein